MNSIPFLPVILGTGRKDRISEKVATYVHTFIQTQPIQTAFFDVRDFPQTHTNDPKVDMTAWKQAALKANGIIIVSPEYNHGYPGELKLFLDAIGDDELAKKTRWYHWSFQWSLGWGAYD